ncbi:YqcC family protein [Exilibacterium tricleocarpae]|uniref:YqcC family protein n=1 Tax=Exilibacterium tricleocarpae TaxID=2591008 RepID=A0A545U5A1_9GAMM|nr:YqcC family protein [Exilibacterium tricleocarpae]TQV84648.1 YqcC family protein [Exilibacterium tricleocarpae]
MSDRHLQIAAVLMDIEKELRELMLWQDEPPSAEALSSVQPFCIDTLTFVQWLQFIFLPRMYVLVDEELDLPRKCGIAPMAQEYFNGMGLNSRVLIKRLESIDRILGGGR